LYIVYLSLVTRDRWLVSNQPATWACTRRSTRNSTIASTRGKDRQTDLYPVEHAPEQSPTPYRPHIDPQRCRVQPTLK
jgi:hypothetical protein